MAVRIVLFCTVLIWPASLLAEKALITRCLLEVGVKTYIDGPCHWTAGPDGNFTISNFVFSAVVRVTGPSQAEGNWNEWPWVSAPEARLGALRRDGACWINDEVTVCAWE